MYSIYFNDKYNIFLFYQSFFFLLLLQRHPNFRITNRINRRNSTKITSTKAIFGLRKNKCPIGSVPIKRATKDDLIRGKSYFNNGLVDHIHGNHVCFYLYLIFLNTCHYIILISTINSYIEICFQYAEVISYPRYDFYNGVSGTSSVYNVKTQKGQSSSAVMYIRNGPDSTSYIGMGWHVSSNVMYLSVFTLKFIFILISNLIFMLILDSSRFIQR